MTLSIKLTKILLLEIFKIILILDIINVRFLNMVFLLNTSTYIRFNLLKRYLYIQDNIKNFKNIYISLNIFDIIITQNISIKIVKKIFLR